MTEIHSFSVAVTLIITMGLVASPVSAEETRRAVSQDILHFDARVVATWRMQRVIAVDCDYLAVVGRSEDVLLVLESIKRLQHQGGSIAPIRTSHLNN